MKSYTKVSLKNEMSSVIYEYLNITLNYSSGRSVIRLLKLILILIYKVCNSLLINKIVSEGVNDLVYLKQIDFYNDSLSDLIC